MEGLHTIIFNAVCSSNRQIQEIAQNKVVKFRNQNPSLFLYQCAVITQNDNQNQVVRQSAATLLGRSVGLKNQNDILFWDCLNLEGKAQIKKLLLQTLGSINQLSKRAAASAISSIATVQVFRGDWPELIPMLVQNTNYPDQIIKRTSIMCLGFICEQFKQIGKDLNFNLSSSMLAGILNGLKKQQKRQMRIASFNALRDSMAFLGQVTTQKKIRDHTLSLVLQALSQSELCGLALQTIIQFSKYNYDYLPEYILPFFNYTQNIIRKYDNNSVLAIQLWNSIGQQYLQRKRGIKRLENKDYSENYLLTVQEALIPHLLSCLLILDNNQNIIRQVASRALSTVAQCCGQIVFTVITNFISNTLSNDDWRIKQASVLAFSCLCEVDQNEIVADLLARGLQAFMELLVNQHTFVIQSTLIALNKIFEFYPRVFLVHINYQRHINILIDMLTQNSKFGYLVVKTLTSITENLKDIPQCPLAQNVFILLDVLTKFVFICKQPEIINHTMSCILNLLQANKDASLALNYVQHMVINFNECGLIKNQRNNALRVGILTAINSAVLSLANSSPQQSFFTNLYKLIIKYFNQIKDVDQDGLYVISSIAIVWRKGFKSVMTQFWQYLKLGLQKINQPTTFKTSLNLLSDIARSLQDQFTYWFQQVIEQLILLIQSNIDRYSKIQIFLCIGDCVLAVRTKASKYLTKILQVTNLAFDGSINLVNNNNSQDFQYSESLRDAIIDMYACLNYAFNQVNNSNQMLKDHFPRLIKFVIMTCNRQLNPTVQYIKNCVFLLVDSAYFYNLINLLKTQQFEGVVNLLRGVSSNNKQVREAIAYAERIFSVRR